VTSDLIFEPLAAVGIAFLLVLLALGLWGCLRLWRAATAKAYLDRVAEMLPWLSERLLVQWAAALPTIVIGLASLTAAVVAAYVRESTAAASQLPGLAGIIVTGTVMFLVAIPLAVLTAVFRRPRFVVPPPLRVATRPRGGGSQ